VRSRCIEPARHHVGIVVPAGQADPWPLSPLAGENLPQMHYGGTLAGRRSRLGRPLPQGHGSNRPPPAPQPPGGTEGQLQASGRLQAAYLGSCCAKDLNRRPTWPRGPGLRRPLRVPAHGMLLCCLACAGASLHSFTWVSHAPFHLQLVFRGPHALKTANLNERITSRQLSPVGAVSGSTVYRLYSDIQVIK